MAWQDELIPTLRALVFDLDTDNLTYTDDRLEELLVVAAKQVATELTFDITYTISVANGTISPDPTATATKSDAFSNLVTLKAGCIIDRGTATIAAKQAIFVKDGDSAIDLRGVAEARKKILDSGGNCKAYEDAKFEYASGQASEVAGAAILTPFRMYARETWPAPIYT